MHTRCMYIREVLNCSALRVTREERLCKDISRNPVMVPFGGPNKLTVEVNDMRRGQPYLYCVLIYLILALLAFLFVLKPVYAFEHINKWDPEDQVLMGITVTAGAIDVLQTSWIFAHDDFDDFNPILNAGVDRYGTEFIPAYFVASGLITYGIAGILDGKARTTFLSITSILESACVINNEMVGVGYSFKF